MHAARKQQLAHIETAKAQLRAWAGANGVPLVHVDFAVPFVETDFSLNVWLFYATDRNVADLDRDGTTARVQQEFLSILGAGGYPAAWLLGVTFDVDSHENVERATTRAATSTVCGSGRRGSVRPTTGTHSTVGDVSLDRDVPSSQVARPGIEHGRGVEVIIQGGRGRQLDREEVARRHGEVPITVLHDDLEAAQR